MTEGEKKKNKGPTDDEEQGDPPETTFPKAPVVGFRPQPRGAMTWPRLTRLRLKDGTPVEDLMLP